MLFKLMFTSFENGTGYLLAGKRLKFGCGGKVEEMFMYLSVFYENCLHMSHIISIHSTTSNSDTCIFNLLITMLIAHRGSSHLMHTTPNKTVLHEKTLFHIWENWYSERICMAESYVEWQQRTVTTDLITPHESCLKGGKYRGKH